MFPVWHFVNFCVSLNNSKKRTINLLYFRYTLCFKKHFTLVTWHFLLIKLEALLSFYSFLCPTFGHLLKSRLVSKFIFNNNFSLIKNGARTMEAIDFSHYGRG